jgi:tripartite-type tricarboxylate transporter receptor subunit TctC
MMQRWFRSATSLAVLVVSLLACLAPAEAQWPTKPVKIIVMWPPGGAADITCRHLQQPLSDIIGQPVVIENKSGGGGVTGTDALARSPADGHTIGMVISSHASNVALHTKLPYDAVKDFKPITIVTRSPNVLAVHPSTPYKSLADIIAAAKDKPGVLHYATSGNGTAQHFGIEHLKLATGIDIVHIPYRGAAPALNDLVAGQVQIGVLNIASTMPYIQSGGVRALAVTSSSRSAMAPDVPSMAETVPGFDFSEWFSLMAPAGVPDEIVEKIYASIAQAARAPTFTEKIKEAGMEPVLNTPAEFRTLLEAEIRKFAELTTKAKIKID